MLKHFLYTRTFYLNHLKIRLCVSFLYSRSSKPGKNPKLVSHPLLRYIQEKKQGSSSGTLPHLPLVIWKPPMLYAFKGRESILPSFPGLLGGKKIRFLPFLREAPLLFKLFMHLFWLKKLNPFLVRKKQQTKKVSGAIFVSGSSFRRHL